MTHHGSWYPSQTAHAVENFAIWLASFLLFWYAGLSVQAAAWLGAWTGLMAATLAEGKSIGNRVRVNKRVSVLSAVNRGDVLDFAVHNVGSLVPVAIVELVPVFWRWLF